MATTYRNTRDTAIRMAYEEIGVAIEGESLEPEYINVAQRVLNTMLKAWQAYPIQLWKRKTYNLTLVAGTASYTLGTGTVGEKVMRVLEVERKDTDSISVPLNPLSLNEYRALSNKTTTGTPVNYYFTPNVTDATITVWPVPDATAAAEYTIDITYIAPIDDVNAGTDNFDYPSEWEEAIVLNLAMRLSRRYGGLTPTERAYLKQDASDALDLALSYDTEDVSILIQPDLQGYH